MCCRSIDVSKLNLESNFDSLVENELGSYVYILAEPVENNKTCRPKPFYIGKGGADGQGNDRLLDHFEGARRDLGKEEVDEKTRKIHEIWARGQEVEWFVVKCEKPVSNSANAEQIESALIQFSNAFLSEDLINYQKAKLKFLMDRTEVLKYAAKNLEVEDLPNHYVNRPIFLFNVKSSYNRTNDFEKSLSRSWIVSPKNRRLQGALAVGLIDSISFCALSVKFWKKSDYGKGNRYEIISEAEEHSDILYKNFKPILEKVKRYWGFGAGGGGIIFQVNEKREVIYIRGLGKSSI